MEKPLYSFNSSQDVINLQTKYTLFKRVANIVFSVTFDEGFDKDVMRKALDRIIERHDCLRIVFVKKGKETMEYFADSKTLGKIPQVRFETTSAMTAYINRFRKKVADCFKGDTISAVFANDPSGKDMILIKVSHFVADTYAIGLIVNDLVAVYNALKNGTELPAAPGRFEDVLKKDLEFKNNAEAVEKDKEFFRKYYTEIHPETPVYCGIHGNGSDRWLKYKKKGNISLPYLFVKCDTEGYRFTIPAAVTTKAIEWCTANKITPTAFFFYTYAITASLVNDKAERQLPLQLLNCRGSLAERKCGGTKVQSIGTYTIVNYGKSFSQNIAEMYAEQNELYKHTRLTYLECQDMEHKQWNYSMLSQITNFCYSFIPMSTPKGITLQVHSNGKGALVDYVAFMLDVNTNEINIVHDIQTQMVTPQQLVDFHNLLFHVIEAVLAEPEKALGELF